MFWASRCFFSSCIIPRLIALGSRACIGVPPSVLDAWNRQRQNTHYHRVPTTNMILPMLTNFQCFWVRRSLAMRLLLPRWPTRCIHATANRTTSTSTTIHPHLSTCRLKEHDEATHWRPRSLFDKSCPHNLRIICDSRSCRNRACHHNHI